MNILIKFIPEIALATAALSALTLCLAIGGLIVARRARRAIRLLSAQVETSRACVEAVNVALAASTRRLRRRCKSLTERLALLETSVAGRSYDQAIEWVRRGAQPDDLTQNFGLSRGEAELVTTLHGKRKSA